MSEKFAVMANIGLVFEKSRDRFFAQLGWLILPTLVLAVVLIGLGAVFGGAMFSFLHSVQFAATTGNPNFLAIGGGLVIYFVILAIVLILFFPGMVSMRLSLGPGPCLVSRFKLV